MNGRLPFLAQRLFNAPLAIHPRKAEVVMHAIGRRFGVAVAGPKPAMMEDDDWFEAEAPELSGYDVIEGVACIAVQGTLVHKLGGLRPFSGMTGYDGIRANILAAVNDPGIRAIVLDIDSPGGEAAGLFDLTDMIAEARQVKPIWAILNEHAYSAAYAIAAACSRVTVPRTGGTGSIGVIAMHVDWSRAISEAGIKVTMVTYGARKADGRPEIPFSDEARAAWQADIDTLGEMFVTAVATYRGLSPDAVRAQEAGCFLGAAGLTVGLADAVMAPDEAFAALLASL